MLYRIEIKEKRGIFDAVGAGIKKDIQDLGIASASEVNFIQVYLIDGRLSQDEAVKICEELLADKISQDYFINSQAPVLGKDEFIVEVAYNPGVMDPAEESVLKAVKDLGIKTVNSVRTARKYLLKGRLSYAQLKTISEKLLYNKLIQHIVKLPITNYQLPSTSELGYKFNLLTVNLLDASDRKLEKIAKDGQLFLNPAEMRQIKKYFQKLKRNPTDCELETIAQTWSEHCYHKTFRGRIKYSERLISKRVSGLARPPVHRASRPPKLINNLLRSTIMKVTKELDKPWCVSVFQDNSGVIRFDRDNNICFKVETHNHPSALEPFGGANTGVGGVIRDPLGTGLGAKPVLNTDVFCFAPPDYPFSRLPSGTLHPKRVMKGVVSGVRDYGNKMGIPTVNGAILFDEGFVGNPLVYCGTVGILPRNKSFKQPKERDFIVVVGGRTGRDGIHGATFSSAELTPRSEEISSGAVQIGNPIQEKKIVDTILEARDRGLYNAITDCGAGGLSSAVGEMARDLGARVYLERVPLKYAGLSYREIWISESQERMVLSVSRKHIAELIGVFTRENVEAAVIGEFTDSKKLKLYYKGNLVCNLDMQFLHQGLPALVKKAVYIQPKFKEPKIACQADLTKYLFRLLARYDIASKEWVIRQYDHEVQGGSVLKPLVGLDNDGPSDAGIIRPVLGSKKGLIVSCGINFRFGFIDPYWMAASCIDEALRQIIAVGGSLKEVALLDNFCWGNPDKPDRLGSLVRASYGCYDIAKAFAVPFISGKDSLNNEYTVKPRSKDSGAKVNKKSIAIPGTLLISAVAVMDDINKAISMYAKEAGDLVYVVGRTDEELGGSHYYGLFDVLGNNPPRVNVKQAKSIFGVLSKASSCGLIKAMHDCSEGGIAIAAAEMAFSGGLGMEISLKELPYKGRCARNDFILFSESNSRFIVEVEKRHQQEFERMLKNVPFGLAGCLGPKKEFKVFGLDGKVCIKTDIRKLKEAWKEPLRW